MAPTRYTTERERALHPNVIHYKRVHKLPMKQAEQPCPILLLLLLPTPLSFPMPPLRQQNKSSLIKLCTYKLSRAGTERQGGRERVRASICHVRAMSVTIPWHFCSSVTVAVTIASIPVSHAPSFCFPVTGLTGCKFPFQFQFTLTSERMKYQSQMATKYLFPLLKRNACELSLLLLAKFIALARALSQIHIHFCIR